MSSLPASLKNSRCILHIDLDCFYCQVEQVRLSIPFDTPAAVQQWNGLIAVNYAARERGIKKMTNVTEARKLCPGIRLLHVATYAEHDTEPKYYNNPDRNTHKVSLDAYRNASRDIFKIFHKHCDKIQKIGTDEGFMDVTEKVNQRLIERYINRMPELLDRLHDEECGVYVDWEKLGCIIETKEEEQRRLNSDMDLPEKEHWNPTTWRDLQLSLGAELATEIRQEVYDKLRYFCSAGIAHYKVVAKLCSSKNKPNKQTVLRESARLGFMRETPFNKIRNLGGKLGNEVVEDLSIQNASELWDHSMESLQKRFGESTGAFLYNICRGIDHEEVLPSKAPKSLMAAKTFTTPVARPQDLQRWFTILAAELHRRIIQHYEEYGSWPKAITLRYATVSHPSYRSKGLGTLYRDDMKTHEILAKKFASVYNSMEDGYPCIGIDLMASSLSFDESVKSHKINRFFTKSKDASAHSANGIEEQLLKQAVDTETSETSSGSSNKAQGGLFSRSDAQEPQKGETYLCDKCNQHILIASIEEHSDYHFALDLMNEERQQLQQNRSSPSPSPNVASAPSTTKKRKSQPKRLSEDDRKQKRSLFFQPKRAP
ncbi:DNA/RNA polymerase [Mucor ambiguus]|uniref:DNA polymerase eta n=1 Tax=Mucor ambiguus TaxID=91626 RepID=A0A0C9LUP8_9FUNG|nr:DNA/RNA polymerase [Mucor ambiguus]